MGKKDFYITVKIKATNFELTNQIDNYIRKKLKSLEKFLKHYQYKNNNLIFEVEVGRTSKHHKKGDVYKAEIHFNAGGTNLLSEAVDEDIYVAINKSEENLKRELIKHTNKHRGIWKRGKAKAKNMLRGLGGRFYR